MSRYFIGTGNRELVNPANWSLTSGGAPYRPAGNGVEKVTNGTFDSNISGWSKVDAVSANTVLSHVSGRIRVATTSNQFGGAYQQLNVTANKWHKLIFEGYAGSGNMFVLVGLAQAAGNFYNSGYITPSAKEIYFFSTVANPFLTIVTGTTPGDYIDYDNISVQEVDDIAPTSAINAIFDANSGSGTITINANFACKDLTVSNLSGALTLSSSVFTFSCFGNLVLPTSNLTITLTGTSYWYMKATTSVQITMGATTGRSFNRLYFDGVGGTWTLQDEMNVGITTTQIYLVNGELDTNGKTTTINALGTATGTKILTLRNSLFIIGANGFANSAPTGFTFNYNTSNVRLLNNGGISGINTFYNLEIIGASSITANCTLFNNQTITGILTLTGNNSTNFRLLVVSYTIGTPRTITVNGTIVVTNGVDFRDIILAGTANRDLSATNCGDCGGNSGIVFPLAIPQYYKHIGGGTTLWSDAAKWFSDTALTVAGRVPIPGIDDALFIAGSFSQACTLSVNVPRIGRSLNMEGVNQAVSFSLANTIECYGSFVLGQNITPSGAFNISFLGRGNYNLNPFEKNINQITFNSYSGIYTFLSNISVSAIFNIVSGTVDANDFNVTTNYLIQQTGGVLNCGNGTFYINTLSSYTFIFSRTLGNFNCEKSTFIFNPSGSNNMSANFAGITFNIVEFAGNHTGNFDIIGSNTFAELKINDGRKVRFTAGTTQTIQKLTRSAGTTPIIWDSITAATHTINITGGVQNVDYINFRYCNVVQQNKLFAGLNSVDSGNNVNVVFGKAELSGNIPFTEIEVIESTLLGKAHIEANLTEEDTLVSTLFAKGMIVANFTEEETLLTSLITRVVSTVAFTETEEMTAEMAALCLVQANFTEEEIMTLHEWERITGHMVFTNRITGHMVFTNKITATLKFF